MTFQKLNKKIFFLILTIVLAGGFFVIQQRVLAATACDISIGYNSQSSSNSCSMSPSSGNVFASVNGHWDASGVDSGGLGYATVCISGSSGINCNPGEYSSNAEGSLYAECLGGNNCTSASLVIYASRTGQLSASAGATDVAQDCTNTPSLCNVASRLDAGFCSPESQTGDANELMHFTLPTGGAGYSWSSPGGDVGTGDNDAYFDVRYERGGTYSVYASYNGFSSVCTARISNSGNGSNNNGNGGGGSGGVGGGNSSLVLQICPSGTSAPCQQGVSAPVNTPTTFTAWYSSNGGSSWVDKTSESTWRLGNEGDNAHLQDNDFNNSCSAGYCTTARGVRYAPVSSQYGPYTLATFMGVVSNISACSANGSGCPVINANYSGTGAQIYYRVTAANACGANTGSACPSLPNSCGRTATGTYQCNGSCDAVTPAENTCPAATAISGKVFNDANSNGSLGGNETGIAGEIVYLRNSADTQDIQNPVSTSANGSYSFIGLSAGTTYRIKHIVPSGWTRTTDDSKSFVASGVQTWDFGVHQLAPCGNGGSNPPTCNIFPVTVNRATGGSVRSIDNAINCGSSCTANYTSGSSVVLTPYPSSSYWKFNGWSGSCTNSTGNCSLNVTGPKTVTPSFILRLFNYSEF